MLLLRENYIEIIKEGDNYVGYHRFISHVYKEGDDNDKGATLFKVKTPEEAIEAAKAENTEYGYNFKEE